MKPLEETSQQERPVSSEEHMSGGDNNNNNNDDEGKAVLTILHQPSGNHGSSSDDDDDDAWRRKRDKDSMKTAIYVLVWGIISQLPFLLGDIGPTIAILVGSLGLVSRSWRETYNKKPEDYQENGKDFIQEYTGMNWLSAPRLIKILSAIFIALAIGIGIYSYFSKQVVSVPTTLICECKCS